MQAARAEVLAWERRWALPAGLAALASVVLVAAAILVATQVVGSGNGEAGLLRDVDAHRSAQMLSSVLQAIGVALLAAPLYFLFRATRERSEGVRGQLVGVVVVSPLFLAVLAILSGLSTLHAATDFVSNTVPTLLAKGVPLDGERANELANEAISNAPLRPLAAGFAIGGQLGFVVAMVYTCLHAMRTGLLTRFWGSLGIALGAVSFLFFQFVLIWFIYVGMLLVGRVPGGRPPAWASGEAVPWPSPGERAASRLGGDDGENGEVDDQRDGGAPRKRKQRS